MNIRDIAAQLHVAPSTVSRAINRRSGVGTTRRDEILRHVAAAGFSPRLRRRIGLRQVGLVMVTSLPNSSGNDFMRDVLVQAERLAAGEGFRLVPMFVHRERAAGPLPPAVLDRSLDGILVAGHPAPDLCRRLLATGIPCVALHDTSARTGCSSVFESKFQAVAEAVRRLVGIGHRRIGLVLSDPSPPSVDSMAKAYEQTLAEHGIARSPAWRSEGEPSNLSGGARSARLLLRRRQGLTAIVFENDRMAVGGMIELFKHGMQVPQDVSVVGCDNDPISGQIEPALTTIDIRLDRSLELAWGLLAQLAGRRAPRPESGGSMTQLVIAGDLIWRNSCGPPRRGPARSAS